MTTCWVLRLFALLLLNASLVAATVTYGGYAFESMPGHFGKLWFPPGKNFAARLQFLPENPRLCNGIHQEEVLQALPGLVKPTNNYTVALLVERGDCSFEVKAYIAMKAFPVVSYLVVYDNEPSSSLVSMRETTAAADNVTLGMLFVSYRAGAALRMALANQTEEVIDAGGPIVYLNGLDPLMLHDPSLADLKTWIMIAMSGFFCFIVVFGCILVFVQLGVIPVNGSGQIILTQEALRRSRRLLTREEVARLQVGGDLHCEVLALSECKADTLASEESAESLEEKGQRKSTIESPEGTEAEGSPTQDTELEEDHSCAVCLDDLVACHGETGTNTTLCLPCKHNFHVDCIVPWLTERHATCPLCKFDVMQFIMDADEKSSTSRVRSSLSWCKERAGNMMRFGWSPVQGNDSQSGSSTTGSIDENEPSNNEVVGRPSAPTRP